MDYAKVLRELNTKLARQRELVQATVEHIHAIEQLHNAAEPRFVQDKPKGAK